MAGETDLELCHIILSNHGEKPRTLSVTSWIEVVVGPADPENPHPALSKMFVHTEWDARHGALMATRRLRAEGEPGIWASNAI